MLQSRGGISIVPASLFAYEYSGIYYYLFQYRPLAKQKLKHYPLLDVKRHKLMAEGACLTRDF